jgi:alanine-glyoxylate transaminase/serine-glyoxylate transaminase/serine-pyruvate transaminase
MSLCFGHKLLAIPGPTNVPDEVLQAMHRPAIDIYAGELVAMTEKILLDLKQVFRTTAGRTFIYVSNGHGVWEAALSNTMSRGDTVLVLAAGRFAESWGDMAKMMGCEVALLPCRDRRAVDPDAVKARLRNDSNGDIKAILCVQIDTASGVVNDVPAIRAAIDDAGHDAIFMVDSVASIGCMPFEMDAWGVDLAITGSQKGLMTPPGLGLMAVGEKAFAQMHTAGLRTAYWDWEFRLGEVHYHKYCGTPPEHLIFGLTRALDLLLREEGLEAAWRRHAVIASATRACIERWSEGGALEFNAVEPRERCNTVTALRVNEGFDAEALRRMTDLNCGLSLGTPIGGFDGVGGAFRLAHMGHVNAQMAMGALGATEASMRALNWPIGSGGLQVAATILAQELATVTSEQ